MASRVPFSILPPTSPHFEAALNISFSKDYLPFLESQIARLHQLRNESLPLWQNDVSHATPILKPFVEKCNSRLFEALLRITEHDDIEIASIMRFGATLVGPIDGRPSWSPLSMPDEFIDEAEIIRRNTADRDVFLSTVRPSPHDQKVFEASMADVAKKRLAGPYYSLDEVFDALGTDEVALLRRFGVEQSDKTRPCDDARRGHVNAGAFMTRKLRLSTIDDFARQVLECHEKIEAENARDSIEEDEVFWRRDHGSAYRQVPIAGSSRKFFVIVF